ncbi:MAG: hypothetical protein ABIO94_11210, partial [Opitutaceae bacterium]
DEQHSVLMAQSGNVEMASGRRTRRPNLRHIGPRLFPKAVHATNQQRAAQADLAAGGRPQVPAPAIADAAV